MKYGRKRENPKTIRHPKQITKGNDYFFLTAKPQLWNQISFEAILFILYALYTLYSKHLKLILKLVFHVLSKAMGDVNSLTKLNKVV